MDKVAANRGETTVVEPTRTQRAIARRAAESRATIPQLELGAEVELGSGTRELIATHSLTAVLVRACGLALREHPRGNGSYRDGRWELYSRINVAVPIAADDGHVLATLFDADASSLAQLSAELDGFEGRALTPPELSGATFSVMLGGGAGSLSPVITPPHSAALGAGAVRNVPIVRNGAIVPGHSIAITLACDHRILYGDRAAALLLAIGHRLHAAEL